MGGVWAFASERASGGRCPGSWLKKERCSIHAPCDAPAILVLNPEQGPRKIVLSPLWSQHGGRRRLDDGFMAGISEGACAVE